MYYILFTLAAVLVVLKLLGLITISWWLAFLPALVAFGWSAVILVVLFGIAYMTSK